MLERILKIFSWIRNNISDIDSTINIIISCGLIFNAIRSWKKRNIYKKIGLTNQIKKSLKYYVPTRGFNIDPCDKDSIVNNSGFELIPFFMKAFKDSESQYFIILADSGMGKTTFLLKLYLKYRRKIFKKYHIVFFPLSDSKALEEIKKIKNKQKTILLLDSFDEDPFAMGNYKNRMQALCNETELFYKVVMTCRTQFFPNSDKEPRKTGNIKFGVGKKNVEFEKYYILPFNDSEISSYLNKKYNHFFEKKKFERAWQLVSICPKLMVRPMLLSYIDDLIDNSGKKYNTVYEIYEQLVHKWIEREALDKNNLLYVFSEKVAEYMYYRKTIYIEAKEIKNLCKDYDINLRSIEAKSRSLLNRNANGQYKFSHKSILEFFLSKKAFKEEEFRKRIISNGFNGYDMLELFIKEKSCGYLQEILQNNSMELKSKVLIYLILSKVDLSGINIIDCDFEGCIFNETNFASSNFAHVNFRKCEFRDAYFENAILEDVDLTEADLTGAYLNGLNLSNTNFQSAKLVFTDLSKSILVNSNLMKADLRGANLMETDLRGANLLEADLKVADLNASIWNKEDIQAVYQQVNKINFKFIMISEENKLKKVSKSELPIVLKKVQFNENGTWPT